jgi:hypothetical protein
MGNLVKRPNRQIRGCEIAETSKKDSKSRPVVHLYYNATEASIRPMQGVLFRLLGISVYIQVKNEASTENKAMSPTRSPSIFARKRAP